jgi:hypothetical protein
LGRILGWLYGGSWQYVVFSGMMGSKLTVFGNQLISMLGGKLGSMM